MWPFPGLEFSALYRTGLNASGVQGADFKIGGACCDLTHFTGLAGEAALYLSGDNDGTRLAGSIWGCSSRRHRFLVVNFIVQQGFSVD